MAERRMIARTITLSDAFLEMPATSRCLYFTLLQSADDDGFVNNPKSLMKLTGATDDDMRILIAKKFVLIFDNGVIVIKHWRIHNYIRSDRYMETKYKEQKEMLVLDGNNSYSLKEEIKKMNESGIPLVYQVSTIPDTQVSIGKDSIDKNNINSRFTAPTLAEVSDYCNERKNNIDAQYFIDYYTARNWELSKGRKVEDWKACVRTWERNNISKKAGKPDFNADDELKTEDADIESLRKALFEEVKE